MDVSEQIFPKAFIDKTLSYKYFKPNFFFRNIRNTFF